MSYILIEHNHLSPPRLAGQGFKANTHRIGFLDFLRELDREEFPFHESSHLLVVGLEDVLLFSRPHMHSIALDIRNRLKRVANDFERCPHVQIVFMKGHLVAGAELRLEMKPEPLPLHLIFGTPQRMENGFVYYLAPFNLS